MGRKRSAKTAALAAIESTSSYAHAHGPTAGPGTEGLSEQSRTSARLERLEQDNYVSLTSDRLESYASKKVGLSLSVCLLRREPPSMLSGTRRSEGSG